MPTLMLYPAPVLVQIVSVSQRTTDEVEKLLTDARIPCGKAKDFDELFEGQQLRQRGMLAGATHPVDGVVDSCGFPIKMSESELEVTTGCPELGQDTTKVLNELLGYDDKKIAILRKQGAIA